MFCRDHPQGNQVSRKKENAMRNRKVTVGYITIKKNNVLRSSLKGALQRNRVQTLYLKHFVSLAYKINYDQ